MRPRQIAYIFLSSAVVLLALSVSFTLAHQDPGGKKDDKGDKKDVKGGKKDGPGRGPETLESFVKQMMAFDKNKDGKLSKEEITDPRLLSLFERADANKDGFVTPEELEALFQRETAAFNKKGKGPPDGKGKAPPDAKDPKGPSDGKVAPEKTPELSVEEKLLKQQIEIYNKLAELYENAKDLAQLEKQEPAIAALKLRLAELLKEWSVRPVEATQAALAARKDQWNDAVERFRKARALKRQ